MNIEAMTRYAHDYRPYTTSSDPCIIGLQHRITNLMERLKDMHNAQPLHPQVWCTNYHVEGHHAIERPRLQSMNLSIVPMGSPPP